MGNPTTESNQLIYRVEDKLPFKDAIFVAIQLLLSVFVAIITPPLIVAGALNLDIQTSGFLVSMALFAAGISTFIQCRRIGPLGAKLLSVQGASFTFIGPIIAAGSLGGLPLIFGCTIAASSIEMLVSRILHLAQKVITPLVSGIVVSLIGLTLLKVGMISCGGGYDALANGTFGNFESIGVAALVLFLIVLFNKSKNKYLRMSSIFIGLAAGYIASYFLGTLDFTGLSEAAWLTIPQPLKYGISFDLSSFLSFALIYLITSVEAYGSITGNSIISEEPITGEVYNKRVSSGIFAEGVNSMIAGIFNAFPNSLYSQTTGVIQLSGVASRYVGYYVAGALIILGLFPSIGLLFSLMPQPVLGGATLLMFGTVAVAGIRIITSSPIGRAETLIIALSFGIGLGVELVPEILNAFPQAIKNIFASGITAGGVTAILANLFIRIKD